MYSSNYSNYLRSLNDHLRYVGRHGISLIYDKETYYSPLMRPEPVELGEYECREHEYVGKREGTRILVKETKKDGVITRYTTTKTSDGFVRQTFMFREDEPDPYPVHILYAKEDG